MSAKNVDLGSDVTDDSTQTAVDESATSVDGDAPARAKTKAKTADTGDSGRAVGLQR